MAVSRLLPLFVLFAPTMALADDWGGLSFGTGAGYVDANWRGALGGDDLGYRVRANYDVDVGGYVLGGGISWDGADVDLGDGNSLDQTLRVGARAGVDVGNDWYYGTLGWARASVDDGTGTIANSNGYYFGIGYETYINRHTTAGAEVLRQQFSDFELSGLELDTTTLNLSVNFRF